MKFRPLADRVLVRPDSAESETASGLVIPDVAQEKPQQGTIEAVGPDVSALNVGDIVVYSKYGGTEMDLDGDTFLVLSVRDVLGVIE